MTAGIYEIRNLMNGKIYIGSAVNLVKRKCNHFNDLRKGLSRHSYLQNAWNKYGEDNFEFNVLLICIPSDLLLYEQRFLDVRQPFKDTGRGYNCWKHAENNLGGRWSDKQRKNYRLARLGIPVAKRSAEIKQHMSEAAQNRPPVSIKTRRRLSESHKGQVPWCAGKKCPQLSLAKSKPYPAFINQMTKEIIPAGVGLATMCRERNLHQAHMNAVKRGTLKHYKKWILLEDTNAQA